MMFSQTFRHFSLFIRYRIPQLYFYCFFSLKNVDMYAPLCCVLGPFKSQGGELLQWKSTHSLIQRSLVQFRARSHTEVMDYDELCIMHPTPQCPKGCIGFLSPLHNKITDSFSKRERGNPGNSGLSSQQ